MGEKTGLERLRELGREQEERSWSTVGKIRGRMMREIADRIEREHKVDYRARFDRDVVRNVLCDMERHVSGVEGAGDSPVALWARELRSALVARPLDPANDASVSAYDLLPEDELASISWVREHGGLKAVRGRLGERKRLVDRCRAYEDALDMMADSMGVEKSSDKVVQARRTRKAIKKLDRRLMPEGMEWPRFEDDAPVVFGERAMGFDHKPPFTINHVVLFDGGEATVCAEVDHDSGKVENFARVLPGERVKRPAPKVLDADGAVIREKRDAWWVCEGDGRGVHAERLRVEAIGPGGLIECSPYNGGTWVRLAPSELYVNKPVLAADGMPLRERETVSDDRGDRFTIVKVDHERGIFSARNERTGAVTIGLSPACFTHERPDSYDALWDDLENCAVGYSEFMRRVKALAGSNS